MKSPSTHPLSETLLIGGLLTFCGGFVDVYTYAARGGVFAFGQTGNLIFLGLALAQGRFMQALYYLLPILCFIAGVYSAEELRHRLGGGKKIHWQQSILWIEAGILAAASFIPERYNFAVIMAFSFASALQTESFRKILGQSIATTMCTGNLRSATELFYLFSQSGDRERKKQSFHLYAVVALFALGAFTGSLAMRLWGNGVILLGSAGLVGISFFFSRNRLRAD